MQPNRSLSNSIKDDIIKGGYWLQNNEKKLDLIIICTGVIVGEVINCLNLIKDEELNIGIFIATSPDALYEDWITSTKKSNYKSHLEKKLFNVNTKTPIITIIDGHSSALSWIGSIKGQKIIPLGVNKFGQSGDLKEVYQFNEIDLNSIVDRIARSILQ
jgi:pyruvate dehydrogenase E1 component